MSNPHHLLIAGLGNTGSHFAFIAARMGLAKSITLIDPDVVEGGNTAAQAYMPEDVGMSKAVAMARHLKALRPDLPLHVETGALEALPYMYFSDVVALCLDHDAPRQVAAERTWQTGGRLLDMAVNGANHLARVTEITPGPDRACLECGWTDSIYLNMIVRHSCRKPPPTRASAALGSLAAGLAAIRAAGDGPLDANQEIVAAPLAADMWSSRLTANARCRFHHRLPVITPLEHVDFTAPAETLFVRLNTPGLGVPGFQFAPHTACPACGTVVTGPLLHRPPHRPCHCGDSLVPHPFPLSASLTHRDLTRMTHPSTVADIGLRPGDVVETSGGAWFALENTIQLNPP